MKKRGISEGTVQDATNGTEKRGWQVSPCTNTAFLEGSAATRSQALETLELAACYSPLVVWRAWGAHRDVTLEICLL